MPIPNTPDEQEPKPTPDEQEPKSTPDEQEPKPSPKALVLATLLQHDGTVHLDQLAQNLGPDEQKPSIDDIEAAYLELERAGLLSVGDDYQVSLTLSEERWRELGLSLAGGIQGLADRVGQGSEYGKKALLAQAIARAL